MDPDTTAIALKYLCSKLDPDSQNELRQLLGGKMPDIAEDALKGRHGLALDKLPMHMQRNVVARLRADSQDAARAGFAERYPDAANIREAR